MMNYIKRLSIVITFFVISDTFCADPGWTQLHHAAAFENSQLVAELIRVGYSTETTDSWGRTPLHMACTNKTSDTVQPLLEAGASLEVKDTMYGFTPLSMAVNHSNIAAATTLISKKAEVNVVDSAGETPLHIAVYKGHDLAVQITMVTLLIQAGARIDAVDKLGRISLKTARDYNASIEIQNLLRKASGELR